MGGYERAGRYFGGRSRYGRNPDGRRSVPEGAETHGRDCGRRTRPISASFRREAGPHGLQGIGANFIPKILDQELYQEVIRVRDEDAYHMGQRLAREEGILTGITSGAAVWAALEVAKRLKIKGRRLWPFCRIRRTISIDSFVSGGSL